jgi:hypothetical protein
LNNAAAYKQSDALFSASLPLANQIEIRKT